MRLASPFASRLVVKVSPCGRSAMSSLSFDTSMPTTIASIFNLPCAIGLANCCFRRPKRLSGLDGPSASSGGGRDTKLSYALGCPGMIRSHVRHRRLDCSACRRQVTRTREPFTRLPWHFVPAAFQRNSARCVLRFVTMKSAMALHLSGPWLKFSGSISINSAGLLRTLPARRRVSATPPAVCIEARLRSPGGIFKHATT
jgi:hypothetical protein